jgi:hypothetical protein
MYNPAPRVAASSDKFSGLSVFDLSDAIRLRDSGSPRSASQSPRESSLIRRRMPIVRVSRIRTRRIAALLQWCSIANDDF